MGVLSKLFSTRSNQAPVETRAHPSADMDWAAYLGVAQAGGMPAVSVEGAQALPAVYACINVISETLAGLPLITYRRLDNDSRERATDHPLYKLLRWRPNPEHTAFEFYELMTSYVCGWGNAYADIEMGPDGQVLSLWPLRPDRMLIRRRSDGQLQYIYHPLNSTEVVLPNWRILHLRTRSGDGVIGYSPLRVAMTAVLLGLTAEEFGIKFFSNGANPGMILQHPGKLSDKAFQQLRTSWQGGVTNAHSVRILEEGMKVEKIGIPPDEAQFLQTRVFQAQEIARIYRMPPHKIGLLENSTFSNIEHQAIEFMTDTMHAWLDRFAQVLWRDLLTEAEQDTIYMEFLADAQLKGDTPSRFNAYNVGRNGGWLSVNEIRARENLPRIADGDGYLQPLNMEQLGSSSDQPAARSMAMPWLAPLVEDAARRITKREAADLRSQAVKVLRSQGADGLHSWANDRYRDLASAATQMLAPVATAAVRATGANETLLAAAIAGVAHEHAQRSRERIDLIVAEAAGQGTTADAALEQYAGVVEAAGAEAITERILAALAEAI